MRLVCCYWIGGPVLLDDRIRLIAATAEPCDSFSARVVSSSRAAGSQQNSQVRASRDRPLVRRGTNGALAKSYALWLRLGPFIRFCGGTIAPEEEGRAATSRTGDASLEIS